MVATPVFFWFDTLVFSISGEPFYFVEESIQHHDTIVTFGARIDHSERVVERLTIFNKWSHDQDSWKGFIFTNKILGEPFPEEPVVVVVELQM